MFIQGCKLDWSTTDSNTYLRHIPALQTDYIPFTKPVTIFTGENGTGKSTLLEAMAIASGFNPEGGTKNYAFSTYDDYSELYKAVRLIRSIQKPETGYFLRAESFYNVASKEEEYADLTHPSLNLHARSHGESFLDIAHAYIRPYGLYFLDEPEAALSPQRQLSLFLEIHNAAQHGAQFFIVTHSVILSGIPDAEILSFDEGVLHTCAYEETESYKITEMFLNNKEMFLKKLLEEAE